MGGTYFAAKVDLLPCLPDQLGQSAPVYGFSCCSHATILYRAHTVNRDDSRVVQLGHHRRFNQKSLYDLRIVHHTGLNELKSHIAMGGFLALKALLRRHLHLMRQVCKTRFPGYQPEGCFIVLMHSAMSDWEISNIDSCVEAITRWLKPVKVSSALNESHAFRYLR